MSASRQCDGLLGFGARSRRKGRLHFSTGHNREQDCSRQESQYHVISALALEPPLALHSSLSILRAPKVSQRIEGSTTPFATCLLASSPLDAFSAYNLTNVQLNGSNTNHIS